jgi:multiple sugar transport system permease protein
MWLFLSRADDGLFNIALKAVGLPSVNWLGRDTALGMVVAVDVWRNVGYWAIFFLAAIIGLPKELYQAAELDGANAVTRFFALTLPLMRRIIFFAVIVATIWALQVFDTVLILTGGGPGSATTTIVMRIWSYVFSASNKVGVRVRHLGHLHLCHAFADASADVVASRPPEADKWLSWP